MEQDTFSRTVKEELSRTTVNDKSSAYWEAVALRRFLPSRSKESDGTFAAEPFVLRRLFYLTKQGSGLKPSLSGVMAGRKRRPRGRMPSWEERERPESATEILKTQLSCRRAFLRGVFMARGSLASPTRTHHLEMAMPARVDAVLARSLLAKEGLRCGMVQRRSNWVVYLKDGDDISAFLSALGANKAVMDYENVRVRKSIKSSVQRLVNMDGANVGRSVEAAIRQLADIHLIDEARGLGSLPPALRELARLRIEHPEMSMEELGESLSAPASKSAVNHRFRRISLIAGEIRDERPS